MGMMRFAIVFAALLLYSIQRRSGQGVDGLFIGSHDSSLAPLSDIDEYLIEHIRSNCELDFLGIKSAPRVVSSLPPDGNAGKSTRLDIAETTSHISREMKHYVIDCLMKQNPHFSVFGSVVSEKHTNDNRMTTMLDQEYLIRKHLAGQSVNNKLPFSSFLAPAVVPRRRIQSSSEAPMPEVDPKDFSPAPLPSGYFNSGINNPISQHVVTPSEEQNSKTKTIVIAVVVTATVTLTLAAICFCCFYRYLARKYQFGHGRRDESPLLSVSNDFSGSSHVAIGKNGALSFKVDPNQSGQVVPSDNLIRQGVNEVHSTVSSSAKQTIEPSLIPTPSPLPPLPPKTPLSRMSSTTPSILTPKLPLASPRAGPPLSRSAPPPPNGGPPPPPLLPKGGPPPPPPKGGPPQQKGGPLPPKGPLRPPQTSSSSSTIPGAPSHLSANAFGSADGKTKLKPFFWDKVMANPDQSMVWHQIKSGSFQFNEEMIESLFGYNATDQRWSDATKKDLANDVSNNRVQILDPKKSQNLAISIKAWNVKVEEFCTALMEGNELPVDLLKVLLRLAPSADEDLKLRLFNDDTSFLGPAEQFLKTLSNIPFAFKRMDALLFMTILQEESTYMKESLTTLEEACKELINSRLFLKLLEAVLKTGNRMNDGTFRGSAQAFKLDTLLKLSDVKGADGKTTLLHFVVQEIIRSEGKRAARVERESRSNNDFARDVPEESEDQYRALGLKVVSSLNYELENVKKAAGLDADALTSTVTNLGRSLVKTKAFLNTDMRNLEEVSGFHDSLNAFVESADADISGLLEKENQIKLLVKSTTDYFHGTAGREEGFRLFVIVRDFLGMLDKACREVREASKKVIRNPRSKDNRTSQPILEQLQVLFPAIKSQSGEGFSSDDDGS